MTYHIATSDVLTVEFGSKPAMRTKISNAQYSKLRTFLTRYHLTAPHNRERKQRHTDDTYQIMTADGAASLTVGRTYSNASAENPRHVSPNFPDRVT
jgi:hypothetical protein